MPTIPNFLRAYNPAVGGGSTGSGNAGRGFGDASISAAVAPGMLGQAQTLVANIRNALGDEEWLSEWKLVTLWIGGNDICSRCARAPSRARAHTHTLSLLAAGSLYRSSRCLVHAESLNRTPRAPLACCSATSTEEYADSVELALDYLQINMPRTFVNLVNAVDVGLLYDITAADIGCTLVRPVVCSRGSNRERSASEACVLPAHRLIQLPFGVASLPVANRSLSWVQCILPGCTAAARGGDEVR